MWIRIVTSSPSRLDSRGAYNVDDTKCGGRGLSNDVSLEQLLCLLDSDRDLSEVFWAPMMIPVMNLKYTKTYIDL